MTPTIIDADTGRELWTAIQCATYLGIARSTWSAYVARNGAPTPAGHLDRLSVWYADQVKSWHTSRNHRTKGHPCPDAKPTGATANTSHAHDATSKGTPKKPPAGYAANP